MAETLTAASPAHELVRSHVAQPPRAAIRHADPDPQRLTLERSATLPIIQPRLLVGPVDDPYEREADRAAEIVAGGGTSGSRDHAGGPDLAHGLSRLVRRAMGKAEPPTHKDEERKDEDDKKKIVQKRAVTAGPSAVPTGVAASINQAMTTGGAQLPPSVRTTFEQRFGHDLASVRVHTDGPAVEATTVLGAKAFTIGEHVFFGAGEYQPGSRLGQWLIAHELAHVVQQAPGQVRRRPIITWEIAGSRFYRTRNGDDIELPEDMTAQEVAQLEDDAIAAERRLADLPPPKPVPEVRKPPLKPAVPKAAKGRPRRKRGKGQAPPKLAEAAASLLKAVGRGRTAAYLAAKGAPVFAQGAAKLARLRGHEQTHDDGGEKLRKSEDAVVIPASEEQSASNAVQVAQVDDRQVPAVDETKGKGTLERSLKENVPRTVGELDNFKRDQKAAHTSAAVLLVVQGDKDSVTGTFGDVRATPPPIPSTKDEAELPPPEGAPATPAMHLGRGAIAPLLKEHTDVSDYTKQADSKLKEEGVTQEQLDMVDSGDLAEANKEKKRMVVQAATEPVAVQQMAQGERTRVDKELEAEERTGRAALAGRRRGALATTGHKQKNTKRDLEKKRNDVAKEINTRYKTVQDHVKGRLDELDAKSMKRFDDGQADAATAFENDVNRELQAYKDDRYSGWFGWARKAKDWLRGMDKLPEVKKIFDRNRAAFEQRIGRLVEDITADNQRVIRECHEELEAARTKIDEFVAGLEPGLQDIGKKAAREMQEKLDLLDKDIANKEGELQNKLKDKQTAAIRAIDEKIEKMKESMSGALAKVGRLLLKAAKKFFTWALEKVGFSLSTIESIIDKGTAVLKAVFTGPIQFVKNLIAAAKLGFANFGKNFVTHLKDALFAWLTDSLPGVTLPDSWTVKGIVSVLLQVVGISWVNLKARLVRLIPAPVVETLQTTFTLVKTLVVEGPMAAWEQIKEMGEELKKAFVTAITDFLKWKVVEEAVKTIAALFVPGAGIVRAIVGIYDTIVFFIQKAREIMRMVGDFLSSIADIAAGKIGAAADALERGLARGLKLVIVFLAKLLRLDGIAARIRTALETIRNKVDAVLDRVASWVVNLAKKAGKLGKDGPDQAKTAPEATAVIPTDEVEPGRPATTKQATAVKTAALDDAERSLKGRKLHSVPEMQTVFTTVYGKYRPAGLKSLSIRVVDEATLGLQVVATASDPVPGRTIAWGDAFAPDDEIRLLFERPPRFETNAAVSVNGARIGESATSDADGHAEHNLRTGAWKDALKALQANQASGVKSTLVLAVNRAPCHSSKFRSDGCTGELVEMIRGAAAFRSDTTFILAPTGVYEPTDNLEEADVDAAENRYTDLRIKLRSAGHEVEGYTITSRAKLTEHTTRWSDLAKLSDAGWDIRQLAVRPKPTSAGIVLAEAAHKLALQTGRVKAGAA